jgi:SPP1 gp7 family putative phage head morphogenesis protein
MRADQRTDIQRLSGDAGGGGAAEVCRQSGGHGRDLRAAFDGGSKRGVPDREGSLGASDPAGTENHRAVDRTSLAHLRTVFNQNVDTAYNDARREVLDEPEMREAFPYRQYLTVGNGTPGVNGVRATHAALHGLIFRSDDPFWDRFTPPWEWGCRCMIVPVTDNQVKGRRVRDAEYVDKKIRVAGEKRRGIRPHPAFDRRRDLLKGIEGELRGALEAMLGEGT